MKKSEFVKNRYDKILEEVQKEVRDAHTQTTTRQELIKSMEEQFNRRLIVYVSKLNYPIGYDDIHIFGSMLESVGDSDNIDLIIQSGGGSGSVAEKMVDMIRHYCRNDFRVIVPNIAKSAATMIALASDEIVMGVTSELGPIDPQIQVIQAGAPQWISAQSFIDARNRLEKLTDDAIRSGKPHHAYIAQLSALNSAFIDHCEKSIDFAKDFVRKYLVANMLKNNRDAASLANEIAEDLTSASKYFIHGRTISARAINENHPLNKLNVRELKKDSDEWKLYFELYLRSELFLDMDNKPNQRKGKLFESSEFSMVTSFPA
jgi:ClpP class serine protease